MVKKLAPGVPQPLTGFLRPVHDNETDDRVAAAEDVYESIAIPYKPQLVVLSTIKTTVKGCLNRRGKRKNLPGRGLPQVSQSGKTFPIQMLVDEMNTTPNQHGVINPHRAVYIELVRRGTVGMLCRQILKLIGCPYWKQGTSEDVRERLREYLPARDVELIVVDEIQYLLGDKVNGLAVSDELKRLLNEGLVPIVFAGDETSESFFKNNIHLAGRLGDLIELPPVDLKDDDHARNFKSFCVDLDAALVAKGIFDQNSGFEKQAALSGLLEASGGHIGRVMRVVEVAMRHAVRRHAEYIDEYDLHYAVNSFAIKYGYCSINLFDTVVRDERKAAAAAKAAATKKAAAGAADCEDAKCLDEKAQ